MDLKNRFITKAALGYSLGMMIGVALTAISVTVGINDGNVYFYDPFLTRRVGSIWVAFFMELVLSGLLGLVGMGGSVMYEIESWSLFRATTTHFAVTMAVFFLVGTILGWGIFNVWMILSFVFVYVVIWQTQSLIYKSKVKQINEELERLRSEVNDNKR